MASLARKSNNLSVTAKFPAKSRLPRVLQRSLGVLRGELKRLGLHLVDDYSFVRRNKVLAVISRKSLTMHLTAQDQKRMKCWPGIICLPNPHIMTIYIEDEPVIHYQITLETGLLDYHRLVLDNNEPLESKEGGSVI